MTWELSKKEHRCSRKRLEGQASWEILGRENGEECSWRGEQNVQRLRSKRRAVFEEGEGPSVAGYRTARRKWEWRASRGVMLRGLYIYTDGNEKGWKRLNLSHVNCVSFTLMNCPLPFFWGQDQAPWPGEWGRGTWYYQDRGEFKIEVGLCKEKPPVCHSFAWWFSVL